MNPVWLISFLPYLEHRDGRSAEVVIGYKCPNRGYGYGSWEETFSDETAARERFSWLRSCGVVERMELRKPGPGLRGVLVDEWADACPESSGLEKGKTL